MAQILIQAVPRWVDFAVKTFIVVFGIYLGISALLIPIYSTVDSVKKVMNTAAKEIERLDLSSTDFSVGNGLLKLRIFGLITNPEVHYRMAEHYKERKEYEKASQAISLAMGLAQPDVKKYEKLYQELQNETSNH